MNVSDFDYILPEERIARFPSQRRDECKLLVYRRNTGEISHARFDDLPDILNHKYNFFRNNAAVLKARIFAKKATGAAVECLLLTPSDNENLWNCMLKPARRLDVGTHFGVDGIFDAEVVSKDTEGGAIVKFDVFDGSSVIAMSERIGVVPLPPYIARNQKSPDYNRDFDNERYETVYANPDKRVAAAAPTAGLHFTPELNNKLISNGHTFFDLTLHVGLGTFRPIKVDKIEDHSMHSEIYEIPSETLTAMADTSKLRLAVGTTSLRAMEDYCRKFGVPQRPSSKSATDAASLFVYPPQKLISADAMITNFHLPRSTLMCLVSAFIAPESLDGIRILLDLYKIALEKEYGFYSYGDAMLIL